MMNYNLHRKQVKKALRKELFPDNFTVSRYKFSPYMACSHGCAYCDGRAEKYYVEGDFERDIVVRDNIDQLLLKELSNIRERGPVTISSGVTDAYQPVEEELGITAKCLDVLSWFDLPVNLLTKSALIERDIPVLEKIAGRSGVSVFISLVHLDDRIREIFEPEAATVEQRLSLIEKLKKAGCTVGVLAMPFLPYLGDSEEHLKTLFDEVINRGADFIMPGWLTLRPGRQKDFYLTRLKEHYPGLVDPYKELFSNNLQSGNPLKNYRDEIAKRMDRITGEMAVPTMVPHQVYRNTLHNSDELFLLLIQMSDVYSRKGIDVSSLRKSIDRYTGFLSDEKKNLGKDIAFNTETMNQLVPDLCRSGKIKSILGNDKLSAFVTEIFLEEKIFDSTVLKLKKAPAGQR
ncbi:SPL family radical SAM protein [Spirochaeta isovalerica]|uniref:DNA repair photolyase n=1 Tax=Spirochaeta isovalerica TaxID=150 RepID=A0A841R7W0_9SPIO|nr:radical SAM protein [Spirochaeta isovalerica]MBB6479277.1 DNA repair photolyase [Spirochaeta isovalerica]